MSSTLGGDGTILPVDLSFITSRFAKAVAVAIREAGIEGELAHVRREGQYIGLDGELHNRVSPRYVVVMKDGAEYEMAYTRITGKEME